MGPAKYVDKGNPVRARYRPTHNRSVRVSCQTIALYTGAPLCRSHTTAVSRWLVIPTAAMSPAANPAAASAPAVTCWVFAHISRGSCSTHPAAGKCCWCSRWSALTTRPVWSKIMQRVEVVPWSIAATYWLIDHGR